MPIGKGLIFNERKRSGPKTYVYESKTCSGHKLGY